MNLKKVMMELGNKLVLDYKYNPSIPKWQMIVDAEEDRSTLPIVIFTEWLNRNKDAQRILEEMGVEWPVVKR